MIPTLRLSFLALPLLLAVPPQAPSDAAVTARLELALQATGLAYEKSATGFSFKLDFEHESGRHQTVFITTQCSRPGALLTHTVYTSVWEDVANEPGEELLRRTLSKSKKLGSFYVFRDPQGAWAVRFGDAFDATDLPEQPKAGDELVQRLRATIEFVDAVGEETDRELNGEKDLR